MRYRTSHTTVELVILHKTFYALLIEETTSPYLLNVCLLILNQDKHNVILAVSLSYDSNRCVYVISVIKQMLKHRYEIKTV